MGKKVWRKDRDGYFITLGLVIFIFFFLIDVCVNCPSVSFYLPVSEKQVKYFQQEYLPS